MAKKKNYGSYIVLNGQQMELTEHPTDFSVLAAEAELVEALDASLAPLAHSLTRAHAESSEKRDQLMDEVREEKVAHHIYLVEETQEEIVIDDRILVKLRQEGTGELERILQEYHLVYVGRMGESHVLQVTDETRMNPLKTANQVAERPGVESASPQVMLDLNLHEIPFLFPEQWYLSAGNAHPDIQNGADIRAPEAWELTSGDPEIVVAVIDDGFDLGHPALSQVRIHPDKWNFVEKDDNVGSRGGDYHGTPVASIAVGAHVTGSAIRGVAPNCTFLPVRIGFGPLVPPIDMLAVFRYVSERADVVNCSFGLSPSSFDRMTTDFRREITKLCEFGGRRGKGLVMVFSAGNDDAPTYLDASDNVNGVFFTRRTALGFTIITEIPAGSRVFSGYPLTEGIVVVGAMSSRKRKSGYSSWGPHLTVTAPSNNSHYIMRFITPGSDPRRDDFVADYRGVGQVAAVNRPGRGSPFSPILDNDDPGTPGLNEAHYTRSFGGTSGAAPIVTGTVALMLSKNPDLSAKQVREIIMATADTDLDTTLDLVNDPNVQGMSGEFRNGHSIFFGAGKINAFHAVRRARALHTGKMADANQPALKHAAFDELDGETMNQISAEDFLQALRAGGLSPHHLAVWPEKKKVELFEEPENMGGIRIDDLIGKLRNEKKKYEIEIDPPPNGDPIWGPIIDEKKKREIEVGPPGRPPLFPIDWYAEKKKWELEVPPDVNRNATATPELVELLERLEQRIVAHLKTLEDRS